MSKRSSERKVDSYLFNIYLTPSERILHLGYAKIAQRCEGFIDHTPLLAAERALGSEGKVQESNNSNTQPDPHHCEEWQDIRTDLINEILDQYELVTVPGLRRVLEMYISTLRGFLEDMLVQNKLRIAPSAGWFARQEPLASFLQAGNGDKDYEQTEFEQFWPQCLHIIDEWKTATDAYLVDVLNEGRLADGGQPLDISALELATTSFECAFCYEAIPYPDVLIHRCFTKCDPVRELSCIFRQI